MDVTTRRRSAVLQLHTTAALEDISADCLIGVDDRLTLYDLPQGQGVDDRLTLYDLPQGQVYKTITYRGHLSRLSDRSR